jgi:GH25 family lysozyme M1 (1,4-beta-N-acetylmuramidase)
MNRDYKNDSTMKIKKAKAVLTIEMDGETVVYEGIDVSEVTLNVDWSEDPCSVIGQVAPIYTKGIHIDFSGYMKNKNIEKDYKRAKKAMEKEVKEHYKKSKKKKKKKKSLK